jgi:hypothetical protein
MRRKMVLGEYYKEIPGAGIMKIRRMIQKK